MRNVANDWLINLRVLLRVYEVQILRTVWIGPWLVLSGLIMFILQWLFSLDQLVYIVRDSGLSASQVTAFLSEGFINLFKLADDLTPISFILIGLLQATGIILLLKIKNRQKENVKKQLYGLSAGLLGAGCVACGGSLITPILGLISSNISVVLASSISDILLVAAVILSYRSTVRISLLTARRNS